MVLASLVCVRVFVCGLGAVKKKPYNLIRSVKSEYFIFSRLSLIMDRTDTIDQAVPCGT